ncbi:HTH-type transcriptional regulator TtgR [Zhongshania aliphaticivorans]|uniref:HTH-type transcriptional regulator TtgR n=1 Tax=Zhongshania aliphaticivorans TaxID=1470434 RepID=A0A5S9NC84_9GAMM|nr:TetR family transcriptional regulator [Zhongshania aliphaticivorans]CAA0087047.1 HTH-type transcriptional regulator TtgR [Zhongshania aliphaticivorans]CAA0113969.1 HTH-type transcriptional regulator TtgR [Zhongshania aliphaticivorans]
MKRCKADSEQTRSSILDAAGEIFAQKGITRTRLTDVASAAGVTRGAIYWHFKDKEALIEAMMDRVGAPTDAALEALSNRQDSEIQSLDMLRDVIIEAFIRTNQLPALEQITRFVFRYALCNESESLNARIDQDRELALDRLQRFFSKAQKAGLVKKDINPQCLAIHIRAHILGIFQHHLNTTPTGLSVEYVAASLDLLFEGIKPS